MNINMSADISGLKQSIQRFKKRVDTATNNVIKEAVTLGAKEAQNNYANAIYSGRGSVTVTYNPKSGKYEGEVVASSPYVLFVEFGTGIEQFQYMNLQHPNAEDDLITYLPPRGSYGHHGGRRGFWFYPAEYGLGHGNPISTEYSRNYPGKILTHGDPGNACLYYAKRFVEKELKNIIERNQHR